MNDLYNLTKEQNIFLAKKCLKENIYHGAKIEGSAITFPETVTILDGVNVPNASLDDIQTILNLRDAWRFTLSGTDRQLDLDFICKINENVARNESLEWGVLRTGSIGVAGSGYMPPPPIRDEAALEIERLVNDNSVAVTQRAIHLFMYLARNQLFWDGNKRTAMIAANKLLIDNGKGIFTIPVACLVEFNRRLIDFYESGDYSRLDSFLYENCIKGIEFAQQNMSDISQGEVLTATDVADTREI